MAGCTTRGTDPIRRDVADRSAACCGRSETVATMPVETTIETMAGPAAPAGRGRIRVSPGGVAEDAGFEPARA